MKIIFFLISDLMAQSRNNQANYLDNLLAAIEITQTDKLNASMDVYQQPYNRLSEIYAVNFASNLQLQYYFNESYSIRTSVRTLPK